MILRKKILVSAIVLPIFSMGFTASADFDCTTVDRDEMMEIMNKVEDGDTLTTTEQTLLDNAKDCRPEGQGDREGKMMPKLTDEQIEAMEDMSDEKKKNIWMN